MSKIYHTDGHLLFEDSNLTLIKLVEKNKSNLHSADLYNANLHSADLSGADLSGANLSSANLSEAKIDYQLETGLIEKIAQQVVNNPDTLEMNTWHTCDTTHCIAGWACHLAINGKEMEATHGTQIAGLLLLGAEAHSHFFDENDKALEYLKNKIV